MKAGIWSKRRMRRLTRHAITVTSMAVASVCLGATGAPKAGELRPPAFEDIEQMCALLASCDGISIPQGMIPQDFSKCVRAMSEELAKPSGVAFSLTIRECGLRANTCTQLRTCALRGAKSDACVGRGGQGIAGFCDVDGRALSCSKDKILAVRDCPRGGEQCVVRGGDAYCALGPCPPEMQEGAAPICSGSGTRILRCEKGKLVSLDCGAFGLKCVTSGGAAACAPDTAACSGATATCDGAIAIGCHQGHEVRIDCAAAGMACTAAGTPGVHVGSCTMLPPSQGAVSPSPGGGAVASCDPTTPPRCEGATIKYCAAGRSRTYPCKAVGFPKCVSDAKGVRCAG